MKKSNWKLNFIHPLFFKKRWIKKAILNLSNFRSNSIFPLLVGKRVQIYNGAWLLTKQIESNMIKAKIGEFAILKISLVKRNRNEKQNEKQKKSELEYGTFGKCSRF